MSETVDKKHDSIMNSLDCSLEISTGLIWTEFASTIEYDLISDAVWKICAGESTKNDEG